MGGVRPPPCHPPARKVGLSDMPAFPDNPLGELARELVALRERHQVPWRTIATRGQSNRSSLCEATKGRTLPTREVVLGLVRGCTKGCDARYRNREEQRFLGLWAEADRWASKQKGQPE